MSKFCEIMKNSIIRETIIGAFFGGITYFLVEGGKENQNEYVPALATGTGIVEIITGMYVMYKFLLN